MAHLLHLLNLKIMFLEGLKMEKDDKYSKELEKLNKRIAENPDDSNLFRERAELNLENGKGIEWLKDIDKAIELDPQNVDNYLFRGKINWDLLKSNADDPKFNIQKKLFRAPISDYKKALELISDNNKSIMDMQKADSIIVDIVLIYIELNDYEKAYEYFMKIGYYYEYGEETTREILKIADYFEEKEEYEKEFDIITNIDPDDYNCASDVFYLEKLKYINDKLLEKQKNIYKKKLERKDQEAANKYEKTKIEIDKKIEQAKDEERNKIIADISHSIKNMISTVIDPLENLKNEKEVKPVVIDNALRGANLIREIVNAMNLSFKGSIKDFHYDAVHNKSKESLSLQSLLIESIKHSVRNMFDAKYFGNFMRKYFPTKEIYTQAKSDWSLVSQSNEFNEIKKFLNKYFFKTDVFFGNAEKFIIGNEKGSAIKLHILFQELILNAVKYTTFVSKENRFFKLHFSNDEKQIRLLVENTYKPKEKTRTTGLGHVIITNFTKLLQTKPEIKKDDKVYSVEINFENFWKNKI